MSKYPAPPNPDELPSYYSFEFALDAYVGTMLYALHDIRPTTLSHTSRRAQLDAKRILHRLDLRDESLSDTEINSALPRGRFDAILTNAAGYSTLDRQRCRPVQHCALALDDLLQDLDVATRVRELLYQARTIEIAYRHYCR
jgi:hypothetical protein